MTMNRTVSWVACVGLCIISGGCSLQPDGMDGSFASASAGSAAEETGELEDEDADADESSGSGGVADDDGADSGSGAETSGGEGTTSGGDDPTTTAADGGDADPDLGQCSNFTSVDQFFTVVNNERAKYAGQFGNIPHTRYKGLPWKGESHEAFTFSSTFAWDDGLAAQAQAEAEAIAAGSSPQGTQQIGSNGLPFCQMAPMWIANLNTATWKIVVRERPSDWDAPESTSCPPTKFALSPDNQHARMGLHYHDFGGDGPAINELGIGAAVVPDPGTGECEVWWVLQFGP